MELIMNEKFEEFNHPELDDFLTERYLCTNSLVGKITAYLYS